MNDPFKTLIESSLIAQSDFPSNSRYHTTAVTTMITKDGHRIAYLKRRIVPPAGDFSLLQEHVVTLGDRLDIIAAKYFNDPELFWQICDANNTLRPESLIETVGGRIRITLPKGVPGQDET
jgi:hypothetical protein